MLCPCSSIASPLREAQGHYQCWLFTFICVPVTSTNIFKKVSHQAPLLSKQFNPKVTLLCGGHCQKMLTPTIRGYPHGAANVGMYHCHLRPDYQLTLILLFMCFGNTCVVHCRVHGLSANVIPYRFKNNIVLIFLPFACGNLWFHKPFASRTEIDWSLVSYSMFCHIYITRNISWPCYLLCFQQTVWSSCFYLHESFIIAPVQQ